MTDESDGVSLFVVIFKLMVIEGVYVKKMLTVIPARGGSKGVPGKNIKRLGRQTLIEYTIRAALEAGLQPIVSTDDQAIADVAIGAGARVPALRPAALATDEASSLDVILHALTNWAPEAQAVCLLQPTSPFRTGEHLREALRQFERSECPAVVSVCPVEKPPRWMYHLSVDNHEMQPFLNDAKVITRRQDASPLYVLNGAIYLVQVPVLRATKSFVPEGTLGYVMSVEDSVDIDTPLDWMLAETLLKTR